jgi:hypothetical protein
VSHGTTDDDARWAEALASLEHGPTPVVRARVRRLRLVALGILGLLMVPALLLPFLLPDRPDRPAPDEPTTALEVIGLVALSLAIVVEATALVLVVRSNRGRWVSPLAALTQRQQRDLRAQVRGEAPPLPARVPLARYLAESALRQRPVALVLLGAALLWTGMALTAPSWWGAAVAVAFAAFAGAAWVRVRREEGSARRFLDQHPASVDRA